MRKTRRFARSTIQSFRGLLCSPEASIEFLHGVSPSVYISNSRSSSMSSSSGGSSSRSRSMSHSGNGSGSGGSRE